MPPRTNSFVHTIVVAVYRKPEEPLKPFLDDDHEWLAVKLD